MMGLVHLSWDSNQKLRDDGKLKWLIFSIFPHDFFITNCSTFFSSFHFPTPDKSTPHTKARWIGAFVNMGLFFIRIVTAQGWYIVTYALGIYHLNLFIAFLTPKIDPALDLDSGEFVTLVVGWLRL